MFNDIIGGDWPYFFFENLKEMAFPFLWNTNWPTGLGGNQIIILPLKIYLQVPILIFVNYLNIPWPIIQRIFWFWLAFGISFYSGYRIGKSYIGGLIYATNSWILMVIGGGQMGVALAFAIAPFVLSKFIEFISNFRTLLENNKITQALIIIALVLSLQIVWDFRVTYLTLFCLLLYFLLSLFLKKISLKKIIKPLFIGLLIFIGLNFFWIFPLVLSGFGNTGFFKESFIGAASMKFLSFANFSNSISLLHPNWPENIFGKIYFMRSQFLFIPLFAFFSLFFINNFKRNKEENKEKKMKVLYFALLALFGAFLAKGTNSPFGVINAWLFSNFPGMDLFRDPIKFYILVAIAYSFLIPYSLSRITGKKVKSLYKSILYIAFFVYWVFLTFPLFADHVHGISSRKNIPQEYVDLKDFFYERKDFFRTFWVPRNQRFGFNSDHHPAIDAGNILNAANYLEIINWLGKEGAKEQLARWSVKYIIVPYDSEGEIFLEDRKYSTKKYEETVSALNSLDFLERIKTQSFNKIAIFELKERINDHIFIENKKGFFDKPEVRWVSIDPARYEVEIKNVKEPVSLIFSESFDAGWVLSNKQESINSDKTKDGLNSFEIEKTGNLNYNLYFKPQKYLQAGVVISLLTLVIVILVLIKLKKGARK